MEIKLDQKQINEVYSFIGHIKNAPERVMVRSINKSLTGVITDSAFEIRKEITAQASAIKKTFKKYTANFSQISGKVESTGKPIPLSKYQHSKRAAGMAVRIEHGKPLALLKHSFKATMPNPKGKNHIGIFWRQKAAGGGLVPRLPIKQLFGPSTPDAFARKDVFARVEKKAQARLDKNLETELAFEIKKAG